MGFHQGLNPEDQKKLLTDLSVPQDGRRLDSYMAACGYCGLDYINTGGQSKSHPSHAGANGQRYFLATIRPYEYARSGDKFTCTADFLFSHFDSKINIAFECLSKADSSPTEWNLDNAEIAAMVKFMRYVEDVVIPHRKNIVYKTLYTNSDYFAGQAWRFNLLVHTTINREVYDFLLVAHRLEYSAKRKAFVKRNAFNIVTKTYPVTEERRFHTVGFIKMNQRLALLGIRVYWQLPRTKQITTAAKERFYGIAPQLSSQNVGHIWQPESSTQERIDEWMQEVFVDPSQGLPSHEGYEAIQRQSPNLSDSSSFHDLYTENFEDYEGYENDEGN
ncbi:hypothetical protein ABKA04_009034 [Annulohypoxylon sp. FPYF3050]